MALFYGWWLYKILVGWQQIYVWKEEQHFKVLLTGKISTHKFLLDIRIIKKREAMYILLYKENLPTNTEFVSGLKLDERNR